MFPGFPEKQFRSCRLGLQKQEKHGLTYSIHPIEEPVPEGFKKFNSGPHSALVIYIDLSSKVEE